MKAGEWQATGLAEGSTCISMEEPAMQYKARCGHVLNADAALLLKNQTFILTLVSGLREKESFCGGEGTADCWGQLLQAS